MHRVLCCGGRDFENDDFVFQRLDELRSTLGDFVVIHGAARGADRACGMWGESRGLPVIVMRANWQIYAKAAGSIRNQWMLTHCTPTYAVAFPGGAGTRDMIARLSSANVPVWNFN